MENSTLSQQQMEQSIRSFVHWVNVDAPGSLMAMLAPEYADCSYEDKSVTLCYPVLDWMRTPGGVMSGGAIAAAMDTTMSCQGHFWYNDISAPVMSFNCNYHRKIPVGSMLCVRAKLTYMGRTMFYASAEAWVDDRPDEVIVSASGVYHIPKTSEHA